MYLMQYNYRLYTPIKALAGGQASKSVAPSPMCTTVLYPFSSLSRRITSAFPPLCDVGSFSSKPA